MCGEDVEKSFLARLYESKGSYCHMPGVGIISVVVVFDKSLLSSSYLFCFTNLFSKQLSKMENII